MIEGLADRLREVGFTVDGVFALLGPDAHRALARNETTPAWLATADGSPVATLVRLFALQRPVPAPAVEAALPGRLDALAAGGVLARSGDEVRALVDVRPYGDETHDWWVVADLTPGLDQRPVEVGPEHVLGISEASSSLAQLTVREPVATALDLGTGCGVQALHLATHADRVVGTDVNPRALWAADLTARLNGIEVDLRDGSLYEPVAGERFDLISTNPPFVVSPPSAERLVYRETSFPGDEVVRRVVAGAADHLVEGGRCQVLAAWVHDEDRPWQERLSGWVAGTGLDAWVVQREVLDLPAYTEMWLADAGLRHRPDYADHYARWLDWFGAQGIAAMGFGWISLRRTDRAEPDVRLEEWAGPVTQPVADAVLDRERRVAALVGTDVLDRAWRQADGLVQDTHGRPGEPDPEQVVLRLTRGLCRARQVDTVTAGLVGASDGDLTAGQILDALASLLDRDPADLRASHRAVVAELVQDGFLTDARP
ncbi:MAG: methyltransferase [Aeromicrobium erythreum]